MRRKIVTVIVIRDSMSDSDSSAFWQWILTLNNTARGRGRHSGSTANIIAASLLRTDRRFALSGFVTWSRNDGSR